MSAGAPSLLETAEAHKMVVTTVIPMKELELKTLLLQKKKREKDGTSSRAEQTLPCNLAKNGEL